jgi:hypothetical protein
LRRSSADGRIEPWSICQTTVRLSSKRCSTIRVDVGHVIDLLEDEDEDEEEEEDVS